MTNSLACKYYYCYCITFSDGVQYFGSRTSSVLPALDIGYTGSPSKAIANKWQVCQYTKRVMSLHSTAAEARQAERVLIRRGWLAGNTLNLAITQWQNGRVQIVNRYGEVIANGK